MKNLVRNIIIIYLLLYISNTTIIGNTFLFFLFGLVLLIHYLNSKKLPIGILIISVSYVLISIATGYVIGEPIDFFLIFRLVFQYILTPYLVLSFVGIEFWKLFEKWLFILTLISIPLFVLNVYYLSLFNNFKPLFDGITRDVLNATPNYWSCGIYTNAIESRSGLIRNYGFMWEPGYFALMIILGIIMHWQRNGIRLDKKFLVYGLALLSTFSTAGYFSLSIILVIRYIKNINIINLTIIIILIFIFINYIYYLSFMSDKIDEYIKTFVSGAFHYEYSSDAVKLNRFQIAFYDLFRVFKNPFGYGVYDRVGFEGVPVTGTNGLTGLLRNWGVFIFIYFMIQFKKFMTLINHAKLSNRILLLMMFSLLILFFSNPIDKSILPFLIFLTPMSANVTYMNYYKKIETL